MGISNLEVVVNLAAPGTNKQQKMERERHFRCMVVEASFLGRQYRKELIYFNIAYI